MKQEKKEAIIFCAVLIWMAISFLAAIPAMAFQPPLTPDVLQGFGQIAMYQDYAYASKGKDEAVAHKVDGKWQLLCEDTKQFTTIELVDKCRIPVAIARHLKVLSKSGMSHEMFIADI